VADGFVVVTDPVVSDLSALQNVLRDFQLATFAEATTEPQKTELLASADAVLVNLMTIDGAVIRSLTKCKLISRFGAGADNVDIEACSRAGIYVSTVVDYCSDEVSDHVMALLLTLARKIVLANTAVQAGQWSLSPLVPIRRLRGQKIGLVGCGRIGRTLAPKVRALGLNVLVFDPYVTEANRIADVHYVPFEELLSQSDIVSIHAPAHAETIDLFNATTFQKMRRRAFLINAARGGIIDENALVAALDEGIIGGVALDVMRVEPVPSSSPLLGRRNVVLTPHMGFYSEHSLLDVQIKAAEEVRRVLTGMPPQNAVNIDGVRQRQKFPVPEARS
jgi:D-3-phosphoglycerate dehydrogenase / 2-oxoglutarate reductase